MNPNADVRLDPAAILDDIEKRVSEIFSAQKSEVEQSLIARINREKEEAQRRIEAVNRDFTEVRQVLEAHKATMAELQSTEEHLRGEIRGHFDRAVNYQKMMENAAILAGGELERIGGLNDEIEKIRVRAESEYACLKQRLGGYAGIIAQLPPPAPKAGDEVNWVEEIGKLRKVRDLLATLRQAGLSDPGNAEPPAPADEAAAVDGTGAAPSVPETETAEGLAASLGLIDQSDDGFHDDTEFLEGHPAYEYTMPSPAGPRSAEPAAEAAAVPDRGPSEPVEEEPGAAAAPAADDDAAVLEGLARYRRTEPVTNGTELAFYSSEAGAVLDAASFMEAVDKVLDGAQKLHEQLSQTTSVKDLFLLKQEILNQQEVLRKVFFRVVRFCDKENGRLPASLDEIIGSRSLRDIIERLTMANWSDPSDFKPFLTELKGMKRAFAIRTSATPDYLRSVLDEVEGRLG
ncbi:MAG: hypothetical protein ABFD52_04540 [Acidobacteriota bacterium]